MSGNSIFTYNLEAVMKISSIIEMKQDGTYERFHVKHSNAKGLIVNTEGSWYQTEYPIINVEKRKVSSKRIPSLCLEKEKVVDIACLIYAENFESDIANKTLSVEEIVNKLMDFDDEKLFICSYLNFPDNPERKWWYLDCINMYPGDDYDCRCDNINQFFKGHHIEGFLS